MARSISFLSADMTLRMQEHILLPAALSVFADAVYFKVEVTHLPPQAETGPKKYGLLALETGILVALVIVLSKA